MHTTGFCPFHLIVKLYQLTHSAIGSSSCVLLVEPPALPALTESLALRPPCALLSASPWADDLVVMRTVLTIHVHAVRPHGISVEDALIAG